MKEVVKMLTRYQELFNHLTRSEAYSPKGGYDKGKINKNKFTPHSLKALLIGNALAVGVYYTTGGSVGQTVMEYRFSKGPRTPEDIEKTARNSTETMIEALHKKYKFTNIEEIILFKGGFENPLDPWRQETWTYSNVEEFAKERAALQNFAGNPKAFGDFNRLKMIAVVNERLTPGVTQRLREYFTAHTANGEKKGFKEQFDSKHLHFGSVTNCISPGNVIWSCPFQYEVNEIKELPPTTALGSLKQTEYVLDSRPPEGATKQEAESEKYKLYRFFEKEESLEKEYLRRKAEREKKKEEEEKKKAEQAEKEAEEKKKKEADEAKQAALKASRAYITALKSQGYKEIRDGEEVAGKDNLFSRTLHWLEQLCTEKPDAMTGYKYKTCNIHAEVLKEKGVMNTKEANIWHPAIFTKSTDMEFRVFAKENAHSFDVIIKLPVGLNEFNFNGKNAEGVALLFSNTNSEKGKTYQCAVMQSPQVKSLSATHGIDCIYEAVEFTLVKNLALFGKSSWLFLDYLKACQGETNEFSNFKNLALGKKVVVGVKPDSLKVEQFDCSGQQQTSGFICGQAGSGKSALMDSLVVQFLALQGDYGNGAVVFMDAKQEWPPLWKEVFDAKGIPFYGFDGSYLSNQESIKKKEISDSGKVKIVNFKETITQEVGGMVFMMGLYGVIQNILKRAGVKDVKSFNKNGCNVDGITRLPRIAIFIDEMNTFAVNAAKGSVAQGIMPIITGGANLTRTAGYMWFLCGQDIPKSIITSEKRGSFKYNIMGTMPSDRYEYFEVEENPNVVQYEEKNSTSENPHPIMTQGTFYAGVKGKTELVRSMYLPDDEKAAALELAGNPFQGMYELDAIVRYGLKNNLFDEYTGGVKAKNNIIFATLRDLGVINNAEFEEATARVLGDGTSEEAGIDKDFWNDDDVVEDFSQTAQAKGQSKPAPTPQPINRPVPNPTPTNTMGSDNRVKQAHPDNRQSGGHEQQKGQQSNTQRSWAEQRRIDTMKEWQSYSGKLKVENNPFEVYKTGSKTDTLLSVKEMTRILREDIEKHIGPPEMITHFAVSAGNLLFNDIAYIPEFDESFIQSLPLVLQEKVRAGILIDFFDMRTVYKFKNLTHLYLDKDLAQGRARKEMGIGFHKRWSVLFKKFRFLSYIELGPGQPIIYERSNPDTEVERSFLDMFRDNPQTTYARSNAASMMDRVWDAKPVRVITKAMGWTAGVQVVWAVAGLMGPWGLLFGGLAAAGAYREYINGKSGSSYTSTPKALPEPKRKKKK